MTRYSARLHVPDDLLVEVPGSTTRYSLFLVGILFDRRVPTALCWQIPIYTPGWKEALSYLDSTCTDKTILFKTVKKSAAKYNSNAKRENLADKKSSSILPGAQPSFSEDEQVRLSSAFSRLKSNQLIAESEF